jgi:ABC-type uncharacterized transport system involved in gliding motility auxiliary subunit
MMKPRLRRFAALGLYLAMIAALASVGLYIVQREFNLPLQISLGLIVVGLALYAVLDPEQVRVALTGRQAKYGSNALVMSVAFLGIVIVLNYLIFNNPKRWDLTENQQFTLAPETLDTIDQLPGKVKILAFYTPRLNSQQAEGLLDQYKYHSDGKVDYEFVDPETEFALAQQYEITQDGTLVLTLGENQEKVTLIDEREITGAFISLISPGERTVYFLTGHGEFDPEGTAGEAYTAAKSTLEEKNYTVSKLNLLAENSIPEDAAVIVIAGPIQPVSQGEMELLTTYLENGGSLVIMEEPLPVTEFGDDPDPLADYLASNWGITLGKDVVVDLSSNQPFVAVANQYGDHVITDKMRGIVTIFPTARSITADTTASQAFILDMVLTSQQSWAETDLEALSSTDQTSEGPQIQPDEGVDLIGPVTIAAVVDDSTSQARLVVFGDSQFASDAFFDQYGNGDLFVNSIDWAAEQEELINLTPKDDVSRLLVPPGRYTMNLVLLGSVFILPGSILVAGIVVWIQRRRRG